ncbi:hypothetical protein [Gordonia phthalatica]|uniref:Uncharacterized protein n=1 Tax=Gordonia phthalatica TaxID=1136941 RepID=A0A0N7FV55_9ACTN|nr:hypothetical protein [Gordonia phthalatica]ALG86215.1 hypothetical protein ACH46_19085 [Gordonia phthalatica]
MSKRRCAAIAAAVAIAASVAPATATAAPALPGPLAGFADVIGIHSNPANKTAGCQVDWNSSATKTQSGTEVKNEITSGVSPARGDNGVTEVQLWGNSMTSMTWRTVVATDNEIANYKLVVKLPAGYAYNATIKASTDNWFGVDQLDNRKAPVKWTKAVGPEGLHQAWSDNGTTLTVTTVKGDLGALNRFVIEFTATSTATPPTSLTTTARSTGVLTKCGGNGSLGGL